MSAPKSSRRGVRKPPEADLGFDWGPLNSLLLALGAAVIAAGYVALSKGSITLAPVLLVSGYCALIPASLLIRGRKSASGE
jgi:drug/metabolite transporter (DMT)-like permease